MGEGCQRRGVKAGVMVWQRCVASGGDLRVAGIGRIDGRGGQVEGMKIRLIFFFLLTLVIITIANDL